MRSYIIVKRGTNPKKKKTRRKRRMNEWKRIKFCTKIVYTVYIHIFMYSVLKIYLRKNISYIPSKVPV